jgi:hypothetical protein
MAEFLALDMTPQAHRPTPRQREHRVLMRPRCYLQRRLISVRNRIRSIVSDYHADRKDLFTAAGLTYLARLQSPVSRPHALDDHGPLATSLMRRLSVRQPGRERRPVPEASGITWRSAGPDV